MIIIEKLASTHVEAVRQVTLADEQVTFAGTADEFLSNDSETVHLHVIKVSGDVVGFFKLDMAYSANYTFCPEGAIGLRAFAIDVNQQGKGIGTDAVKALFLYIKENYPACDWLYLTVNCKNLGAYRCYQKGGFEDIGEKYLGGPAGPQYIMRRKLD